MTVMAQQLRELWTEIKEHNEAYRLLLSHGDFEWYLGYAEHTNKTLLIISSCEPMAFPSSSSVLIRKGKRRDGRWTLSFVLTDNAQTEVFELLCADLINYTLSEDPTSNPMALLLNRYQNWHKLLSNSKKFLLSEVKQKKLLGQLIFLNEIIELGFSKLEAVQGWQEYEIQGPDFIYENCWYVIKSLKSSSEFVEIESLEQLGNPGPGELIIQKLDKADVKSRNTISLYSMAEKLLRKLAGDKAAKLTFEAKLFNWGYCGREEYDAIKYIHLGQERFKVDDAFPRILRSNVNELITDAEYSLQINKLDPWKMGG